MKKIIFFPLAVIIFILCAVFLLNISAATRQCVNYKCRVISVPLYLKAMDFLDRHFNYAHLTKTVIEGAKNDEERVLRLLEWTYRNIKKAPNGLPVVDDHIWYTIVRGYGVSDQFQDAFTTLCNYAKLNAFFCWVNSDDRLKRAPLSFVRLDNKWYLFDAESGVYFINAKGKIADINDLSAGDWRAVGLSNAQIPDYSVYFGNIKLMDLENYGLSRPAIQSPLRRLFFWINGRK